MRATGTALWFDLGMGMRVPLQRPCSSPAVGPSPPKDAATFAIEHIRSDRIGRARDIGRLDYRIGQILRARHDFLQYVQPETGIVAEELYPERSMIPPLRGFGMGVAAAKKLDKRVSGPSMPTSTRAMMRSTRLQLAAASKNSLKWRTLGD